jgi:predicted nucleic acid-binding protein
LAFDLDATLRRLKPGKRTARLTRRSDHALPFVGKQVVAGPGLLLDTSVYIDVLQGRAPSEVKELLLVREVNHSAIALAELVHLFGRLDPSHKDSKAVAAIAAVIAKIRPHRLTAPSVQALADAGIVTGTIARLAGLSKTDRQPMLNDATLFMQALESGFTLLSGNVSDMDLIEQLVPSGRILLYRRVS